MVIVARPSYIQKIFNMFGLNLAVPKLNTTQFGVFESKSFLYSLTLDIVSTKNTEKESNSSKVLHPNI